MCNFLACLYLSAGAAVMQGHPTLPPDTYYRYDINDVRNPYGIAEIGYAQTLGRWSFEVAARHQSSLGVDYACHCFNEQRGSNQIEVRVRLYPFAREIAP